MLTPSSDPEAKWLPIYLADSLLCLRQYSHAEQLFCQVMKKGYAEAAAVATARLALIAWERDNKAETLKLATRALEVLPKQYVQEIGTCKVLVDMCNGVYYDNLASWIESVSILINVLPSTESTAYYVIMGSSLAQSALENALHKEGTEDTDKSQVNWLHVASGLGVPLKLHNESGQVYRVTEFPDMSSACIWSYKFYMMRREALLHLETILLKKGR